MYLPALQEEYLKGQVSAQLVGNNYKEQFFVGGEHAAPLSFQDRIPLTLSTMEMNRIPTCDFGEETSNRRQYSRLMSPSHIPGFSFLSVVLVIFFMVILPASHQSGLLVGSSGVSCRVGMDSLDSNHRWYFYVVLEAAGSTGLGNGRPFRWERGINEGI